MGKCNCTAWIGQKDNICTGCGKTKRLMKLTFIHKDAIGNRKAGIRFAKGRLKRMKNNSLCLVTFLNGHVYVYKNEKGKLILPSYNGKVNKELDKAIEIGRKDECCR